MDPMTLLTLAKGAKWAWDEYRQASRDNPGRSIEELRARLDAGDALVQNHFELIEALGQQLREVEEKADRRLAALQETADRQATELARLQARERTLLLLTAGALAIAAASLGGLLVIALH